MNPSDDPSVNVAGGSARVGEKRAGGHSRGAFWLVASVGVMLLALAWTWYGFAFYEEMTEQGKAAAAGSSMAGTGMTLGGVPLVLAHLLVLVLLLSVGVKYHSRRAAGIVLALAALVAGSVVGIAVAQLLWRGMLFTMYADAPGTFVP